MATMTTNPDRKIKNGVIIYRKLNPGDLVEYTDKKGIKSLWRVNEVRKDEIMYGPMKGSQIMKVEIGTPHDVITVNRDRLVKIDEIDD